MRAPGRKPFAKRRSGEKEGACDRAHRLCTGNSAPQPRDAGTRTSKARETLPLTQGVLGWILLLAFPQLEPAAPGRDAAAAQTVHFAKKAKKKGGGIRGKETQGREGNGGGEEEEKRGESVTQVPFLVQIGTDRGNGGGGKEASPEQFTFCSSPRCSSPWQRGARREFVFFSPSLKRWEEEGAQRTPTIKCHKRGGGERKRRGSDSSSREDLIGERRGHPKGRLSSAAAAASAPVSLAREGERDAHAGERRLP